MIFVTRETNRMFHDVGFDDVCVMRFITITLGKEVRFGSS